MGGSEAELEALVHLENRNFPDEPTTVEVLRYRARKRQSFYFAREEAVWSGDCMIGYGSLHRAWWLEQPGRYRIYVSVDRDWRRRGIGTRIWQRLLSLATITERIRWLESGAREDRPDALDFLRARGFEPEDRVEKSELALGVQPWKLATPTHRSIEGRSSHLQPAGSHGTVSGLAATTLAS